MLKLPDIITLNDFGGVWAAFEQAVYNIFRQDFVLSKPVFEGKRLQLKKYPIQDGREATFYHLTSEGLDENNRTPDIRRMERIGWPKPIINNSTDADLKVWRNKRGKDERILILHEAESYLVVLADRGDYILPWTAYFIEHANRKRKLLQEYEAYIKNQSRSM